MKILYAANEFEGARGKCTLCGTEVELEVGDVGKLRVLTEFWRSAGKKAWLTVCPNCEGEIIECEKPK